MATATRPGPFARKPMEHLVRETGGDHGLKRAVGVLDLAALGVGAIIGTGIFVVVGRRCDAGPSSSSRSSSPAYVPGLRTLLWRARLVDPGVGLRVLVRVRHHGRAARLYSSAAT